MKKKEKKNNTISATSSLKDIVGGVKIVSIIALVINILKFIAVIGISVYTITVLKGTSVEQAINNEKVIDYISFINSYENLATKEYLIEYEDTLEIIILEVVVPVVVILGGLLLFSLACGELLILTKKSKDNKTLFTKENLESLKKVRTLLIFAFVCVIVVSDFSIFTLAIFELLIEVVIYLFSNCIKYETKELEVEEN